MLGRNQLWFGENVDVLRNHIPEESVALIYTEPPFNGDRNYNVLFRERLGKDSETQISHVPGFSWI